jgi:hypothetical protein
MSAVCVVKTVDVTKAALLKRLSPIMFLPKLYNHDIRDTRHPQNGSMDDFDELIRQRRNEDEMTR